MPRVDIFYQIWLTRMMKEDYVAKYDLEVHYLDELPAYL